MLVKNLMNEIGFTVDEQNQYHEYRNLIGDELDNYAKAFMTGEISFEEALTKVRDFQSGKLHQYTTDLLFILECTSFLLEKYEAAGIPKDIFINGMKDIKYKLEECIHVKNVFGTFVADWYEGFFCFKRIALGRLQYDITTYGEADITIGDYSYTIHNGDFILSCHIPSSGPLKSELCIESFKMAYDFFKDRLKNNVLPIMCNSWLLYPPYLEVFGEKSNTADFSRNFNIVAVRNSEDFNDMWRVFGAEGENGDTDKLPTDTAMQRSFIRYIKSGGGFGTAMGVVLFDGEKVLTRHNKE